MQGLQVPEQAVRRAAERPVAEEPLLRPEALPGQVAEPEQER